MVWRRCVALVLGVAMCFGMIGCGDRGTDYGAFRYAPADGWEEYVPPEGISFAAGMHEFCPDPVKRHDGPRLEIREVTDGVLREERIPGRYAVTRERMTRFRSERAVQDGEPPMTFECSSVEPAMRGPGAAHGLSITRTQGSKTMRELVHWIHLPDGRRFRARYSGEEPAFGEHEQRVITSLRSLRFPSDTEALSELSRDEVVDALVEHLDGDRLWIEDGKLRGRVLNDRHLEALTDPIFRDVRDFNVNPTSATTDGVEVTDDGLRHLAHLPLESLCLRGESRDGRRARPPQGVAAPDVDPG